MRAGILIGVLVLALAQRGGLPAAAAEGGSYYVSLKSDEVFMREGPSEMNRIKWVYRRKGMPMEVLAAYDVWRRVRDMDGEIGWIHMALLSRDRTAVVAAGADAPVRLREDPGSEAIAAARAGALGQLVGCGKLACEVRFDLIGGWIDRARLWGIRDGQEY